MAGVDDIDELVDYHLAMSGGAGETSAEGTLNPTMMYNNHEEQGILYDEQPGAEMNDCYPTANADDYQLPMDQALPVTASSRSDSSAWAGRAYDRISRWQLKKNNRLKQQREEANKRQMSECPFRPIRPTVTVEPAKLAPSPLYQDNRAWGYDEFIDRYSKARQKKDEEKEYAENYWACMGDKWTPKQTVPQPFPLGSRTLKRDYSSLHKNTEKIAKQLRPQHQTEVSRIEEPSIPSGLFSMQSSGIIIDHSPQRYAARRTQ